jgi:sterol desaturase/sphingolipid hydroxylase (fatty acid hydroxylase superfamily)
VLLDIPIALINGAPKMILLCAAGLAVEYLRPADRAQPWRDKLFNFVWIVNFVVMTNLLMVGLGRLVPMGVAALGGPLFSVEFPDSIWGGLAQFTLLMLIHDFCYYCMHRCQHTWPWFWAHHKLHHTEVNMNATTSFRHHWLENVYRIPFIFIPMGMFKIDGAFTALAWDLALVWAIFTHMNLRITLGPLRGWIAGPQVHRIHHSALPEHQNRNFGAFFPIWDRMFGTWHRPLNHEFPPCGMLDGELTPSVWQANVGVFREWWRLWKQGRPQRRPDPIAPPSRRERA